MAADVVEVLNDRRASRQTRVQTGQVVRPRQKLGHRDKRHLETAKVGMAESSCGWL